MIGDMTMVELGEFFGYPECCIADFISRNTRPPVRKLKGTGYIPCAACNEKSESELIATIMERRAYHEPFPLDGELRRAMREQREEVHR